MEDYYADDKETEGLLHRCRILSQEMLFFLSNVQGFFMVLQAFRTFLVHEKAVPAAVVVLTIFIFQL